MELLDTILNRRSVREYKEQMVPEELINDLLKAGAAAPSAMNLQPCRFIVITNKGKIRELSDKVKMQGGLLGAAGKYAEHFKLKEDVIFYGAPLLIFIAAEKNDWSAIDCSLAAQNMMLRARDLELGSCFIGFASMLNNDRETLRGIGITDSQELCCPLIFGYPKRWPHPKIREPKVQKRVD
ncbi:Nitroreductase family protein [uncultured archaeon]|nr:Nitroreductase family protein [uncultured archaeon]